jgi:glutathione peroxidase
MPKIGEIHAGYFLSANSEFCLARSTGLSHTTSNRNSLAPNDRRLACAIPEPLSSHVYRWFLSIVRNRSKQVHNPLGNLSRAGSATCLLCLLTLLVPAAKPTFAAPLVPAAQDKAKHPPTSSDKPTHADKTAYDYNLPGADGKDVPLSNFKGKYVLVVNLARNSIYDSQLPALIKLSDTYKAKGLVVIGVPSNDFGSSEPGTNAEVQKAYADTKVNFPVMSVSKLSGEEEIPFYLYLTKSKNAPPGGDVHWNFTKFLLDKNGKVVARLNPDVAPDSPEMLSTVDEIVDGTFKPRKASEKKSGNASSDDDDDQ